VTDRQDNAPTDHVTRYVTIGLIRPHVGLYIRIVHKLTATWPNNNKLTRMWANAQLDGRPAEHRWRPLFNAAKFG